MKKIVTFLMAALLTIALCACSTSVETTYEVTKNGREYIVDTENSTISDGINTYRYTFSGNSAAYTAKITYPDGSSYWWSKKDTDGFSTGGWSDDYDENRYVDGETLCDILLVKAPKKSKMVGSGELIAAILLIAIGAFNAFSPYNAWYWEYGWRFKDAKPSDTALGVHRASGVIAIIVGLFIIFI